jgi:hypothetical protein
MGKYLPLAQDFRNTAGPFYYKIEFREYQALCHSRKVAGSIPDEVTGFFN